MDEEVEKSVTLTNAQGDEAIVVDTPANREAWAKLGYKACAKDTETQVAPVPDLSVDVGDVADKPAKKRAK